MRVGLVLGAGGVMGGAWTTGGLEALARETGWDPGSADYVVGTSAGAMMGTLVASGIPPWFMVAHSAGRDFDGLNDAEGQPASTADRSAGASYRLQRAWPRLVLGSPRLALNSVSGRGPGGPYGVLLGLGPRGMISTEPLKEIVRRVVPTGWSPHPNLWLVAADYESGERVVFGRKGSPRADLADAVAASCAVPSFYCPVEIGGRLYFDGGVYSVSNLDLLAGLDLDLVVCLNPMTSRYQPKGFKPVPRLQAALRRPAGRRLATEAKLVRSSGTRVALIQPTVPDLQLMGSNWLSGRSRHAVIEQAITTVGRQLRQPQMRQLLAGLPAGEPRRLAQPAGIPISDWPEFVGAASVRRKTA